MLPIQAKPVSRSAQPKAAKLAPQVGASGVVQCQLCVNACNKVPDPLSRLICLLACYFTGACP